MDDVQAVFDLSIQYAEYDQPAKLTQGVSATFRNAGHILGSASIQIDFQEDDQPKTVVFSGDLGNHKDVAMPPPAYVEHADALYIESTYGDRNHRPLEGSISEFKQAIVTTLMNQGNVLIPSFAIERSQEILLLLKQMYYDNELPTCKVFLDSPMAIRATEIYNQYHTDLNENAEALHAKGDSVFDFPYLEYSIKGSDSMRINDEESGCIIIAGSGMCTGGRICTTSNTACGTPQRGAVRRYQAVGTLGAYWWTAPRKSAFTGKNQSPRENPYDQRLFGSRRSGRTARLDGAFPPTG